LRKPAKKAEVIYTAGKYRGKIHEIYANIQLARYYALQIWQKGHVAICPHLNTMFMDGWCPDEKWLSGDLLILERCDAIFMIPGWEYSQGARTELTFAQDHGLKVYYSIDEL